MGAGCSADKSADAEQPHVASGKSTTMKSGSGRVSRRTREDLASQFVADIDKPIPSEFPADEDPNEVPSYPEGSREATLLKVFNLLDQENCGYLQVPVWKDYVTKAGLTTEALAKELTVILAQQGQPGDPQVSPRQFITAMTHMLAGWDDPAFGQFVAQTLNAYRAKGASRYMSNEQVATQA